MSMTAPQGTSDRAILFLDLQANIVKNSRTVDAESLAKHATVLAKLAALHRIPAFISSVPPGGDFAPSILEALGQKAQPRTFTSAFGDDELVADLKASGRRTLILSGVVSEMVVQQTALDALGAGYDVLVAVDACGGISDRTEDAAWRRISGAGGSLTSVATFGGELAGDLTSDIGKQTFGLVAETFEK